MTAPGFHCCAHAGCQAPATALIKLNVPILGEPIGKHRPLQALYDRPLLCAAHFAVLVAADLLTPELRATFDRVSRRRADFVRAFVTPVDLAGLEAQRFLAKVAA